MIQLEDEKYNNKCYMNIEDIMKTYSKTRFIEKNSNTLWIHDSNVENELSMKNVLL